MADRRVADRRATRSPLQRAMWLFAAATASLYLIAAGIGAASYLANRDRIAENQALIVDIQAANVKACRLAYQSILDVFEPFLPPKETKESRKFKATVARYVRRCSQVEGR